MKCRVHLSGEELCYSGGVKPLLLGIERSQFRWLGHLFGILPRHLPVLGMSHQEETPRQPQACEVTPDEFEELTGAREVWVSRLRPQSRTVWTLNSSTV